METTFTHKGHTFSQIDESLGNKQELESLARAELEKIHWEEESGGELAYLKADQRVADSTY